jgi:hypothetical protein
MVLRHLSLGGVAYSTGGVRTASLYSPHVVEKARSQKFVCTTLHSLCSLAFIIDA